MSITRLDALPYFRHITIMWATKPYRNAVAVQGVIMSRIIDGNVEDRELASLARALCDLEETKRKLRMKPLPKSVDVEKYRKPKQPKTAGPSFTES